MIMFIKAAALAAALTLGGCASLARVPDAPTPAARTASQEAWTASQVAYEAWSAKRPGVKVTGSGLQYRRLSRPKWFAPRPPKGSVVTIHYVGKLITGETFDSTRDRGEPATFPLTRLILGWQEGVPLMRVGETFEFVVPAKLGYGGRAMGDDIPANSTLVFQIKLLEAPEAEGGI